MFICNVFKSKACRYVQAVFCAFVVAFCLCQDAYATENTYNLPTITKWVNGLAFSESGTFLYDTWAVDDTGVSPKRYVLINQNYEEVMRIENYPEDMADGDTAPCRKYSVQAALDLLNDVSGDIYVTIENESAEYLLTFHEDSGYKTNLELYPGVYEVTDVEVAGDLSGTYSVSNYGQIDVSSDLPVTLTIVKDGASGDDTAGESDDADSSDDKSSSDVSEDNNKLLGDTIKLFVVVTVLFIVYAVIKYRRAKSEEMKQ